MPDWIKNTIDRLQRTSWKGTYLHPRNNHPIKKQKYCITSNEERVLKVPKFKHDTFGKCAFAVYGPLGWNCLQKQIRLCDEIEAFKRNLKTRLFVKFVNWSTLAIRFWKITVKHPRMLSAQFVALYKPCKPKPCKPKPTGPVHCGIWSTGIVCCHLAVWLLSCLWSRFIESLSITITTRLQVPTSLDDFNYLFFKYPQSCYMEILESPPLGSFWCAILIAHQIVMAKHGGSCVHFSEISTCGRTSRETVSYPQCPPLPTLCKISLPIYVIMTNQ